MNGILKGMEGTAPQRPPAMGNMTLGRGGAYDGLYTAGELDDVRISSRALSDSEIEGLVRSASRK